MGKSVQRVRVTRQPSLFGYQALAHVVAAKPIRLTQSLDINLKQDWRHPSLAPISAGHPCCQSPPILQFPGTNIPKNLPNLRIWPCFCLQYSKTKQAILIRVLHYAEGGATEAYCNRAVCPSVTSISRRSLKTKR